MTSSSRVVVVAVHFVVAANGPLLLTSTLCKLKLLRQNSALQLTFLSVQLEHHMINPEGARARKALDPAGRLRPRWL